MESPPTQYLTTRDGFDLAYTVTGEGRVLVQMPFPYNHLHNMWQSPRNRRLYDALAQRFRLVRYDSRGHGMSNRGLPEDHSIQDYVSDLEAIVDGLDLQRFVLFAGPLFSHAAILYAVAHPERVEALHLDNASIERAWGNLQLYEEAARKSWDMFIHTMAATWGIEERALAIKNYRDSVNREDFLAMLRAAAASNIAPILPKLKVPVLITASRMSVTDNLDQPKRMAAAVPNARLVLFDVYGEHLYGKEGATPPIVLALGDFLDSLPAGSPAGSQAASKVLSPREVEVLRLVSQGKTNREIATELVISEWTVVNHLSHIFTKTGAENRAAATAYALRHGLA